MKDLITAVSVGLLVGFLLAYFLDIVKICYI